MVAHHPVFFNYCSDEHIFQIFLDKTKLHGICSCKCVTVYKSELCHGQGKKKIPTYVSFEVQQVAYA
jgi:hypothetical protein